MKTKIFTLIFVLMASTSALFAESGTCGDNLTWNFADGVLTISGTGEMTNYTFNYDVNVPWNTFLSSITTVNISEGVTSIGDYAFTFCYNITSVTIPSSVTRIGKYAFDDCTGLTTVYISDLSAWCNMEFYGFPANPTRYAEHLYLNGSEITDLVIPNDVTIINAYAFWNCSGLVSVTFPNSVTSIGYGAFNGCSGLTSITNYASVPQIIDNAVFNYVNKNICILYVPKGSVNLYKTASVWSEFFNIVGVDAPEGIENTTIGTTQSTKTIRANQVLIQSGEKIYTLQGQEIK